MDRCSECKVRIKNGEIRHACCECSLSYLGFKLCAKCHAKGLGKQHTEEKGYLHWFEHRNSASIDLQQFDVPLEDMLRMIFRVYSDRPSLGRYVESQKRYEYFRYSELGNLTEHLASEIHHLMSQEWEKMVAIFSMPRVEWYVTDLACVLLGIPTVGIAFTSDKENLAYMLQQTGASIIVCPSSLVGQVVAVSASCPALRRIVVMDLTLARDDLDWEACCSGCSGVKISKYTELLHHGEQHPADLSLLKLNPEDPFTIFYTSGTTGRPKGCVHLRKSIRNHMWTTLQSGATMKRIWLSFQPPSHVMERNGIFAMLATGGMAGIYRGSMEHLLDDARMVCPTYLQVTPRFFSTVHNEYLQALDQAWREAGDTDKKLDPESVPLQIRERVLRKFKEYIGGRQKIIILAGAATSPELRNFVETCFEAMVLDVYGTSETGILLSDGEPVITGDICLMDVPDMGYLTTDEPPRGEICIKSANTIQGYYKNQEETKEKFIDGYFRTGDIGIQESSGSFRIIDRKKNIFKLAQGEFVVPERIEAVFESNSSLIEQVFLYGNSTETGTLAVVVPFQQALMHWWNQRHLGDAESNVEALCSHKEVQNLYLAELRFLGKAHGLQGWEIPLAILLEPHPFTAEKGLLTSTHKKSRPRLEREYKQRLDALYTSMRSVESMIVTHFLAIVKKKKGVQIPEEQDSPTQPSPLDLSLTLTQLGGDSLAAMHLSSLLLEQLSVEVPAAVLLQTPLHDILHSYVLKSTPSNQDLPSLKDKQVPQEVDWEKEMDISFLESEFGGQVVELGLPNTVVVLLTGAAGFVGKFVLWQLMQDPRCGKIYCLLRERKGRSAQECVEALLRSLASELLGPSSSSEDLQAVLGKVVCVYGDVSLPNLGLREEVYAELSTEIHVVIHGAANVNHILPYFALKEINVGGTKEILKFCCRGKSKFLHYVSTIAVTFAAASCSQPHKGTMQSTGYAISKWVSEQLVLQAVEKHFIYGSVSRPGMVGAHSITGHPNQHDWFFQLVCGLKRMGCYPAGMHSDSMKTDIVPVDVLARAIVFLSIDYPLSMTTSSRTTDTFDIVNTNPDAAVTFMEIVRALERVVHGLQPTDDSSFVSLLSSRARRTRDIVLGSLDLLLPEIFLVMSMGVADVSPTPTGAAAILESAGINVHMKVDGYMQKYVGYLTENKLL